MQRGQSDYTDLYIDWLETNKVWPFQQIEQNLKVEVPTAHRNADPNHAYQLNVQYQQELKKWKALPWWKRIRIKKPTHPTGDLILKKSNF